MITCHLTGRSFDPLHVPANPFRCVPGTRIPIDKAGVDVLYPEPSQGDPNRDAKVLVREQALADVAVYDAAAQSQAPVNVYDAQA